ncbi:hypothetical protein M8C21_032233 [Ambrosia artemisiifolia]|uniref:Uncharacterized protein n=1 Tax=Ambrosia artemisiifolia TaxID=4212 RepID=A0AAD5C0K0_AMBAR|nr:hypothetical protein M8C21_032233 [Ambrosia artemisiifolia]
MLLRYINFFKAFRKFLEQFLHTSSGHRNRGNHQLDHWAPGKSGRSVEGSTFILKYDYFLQKYLRTIGIVQHHKTDQKQTPGINLIRVFQSTFTNYPFSPINSSLCRAFLDLQRASMRLQLPHADYSVQKDVLLHATSFPCVSCFDTRTSVQASRYQHVWFDHKTFVEQFLQASSKVTSSSGFFNTTASFGFLQISVCLGFLKISISSGVLICPWLWLQLAAIPLGLCSEIMTSGTAGVI